MTTVLERLHRSFAPSLVPEDLSALVKHLDDAATGVCDLELSTDVEDKLGDLLSPALANHFIAIGEVGSGSVLACWKLEDGRRPLVWIGSEGTSSVFARDASELMTLLPYDTGFVGAILELQVNHAADPDFFASPTELYDPTRLRSNLSSAARRHKKQKAYREWLTRERTLDIAPQPVEQIQAAIRDFPELAKWLKAQGAP